MFNFINFYYLICVLFFIFIFIKFYRNYCHYQTFKKININYCQKEQWEKDLNIYSISMPRFYSNCLKKSKCILLIGGYKDIPYLWNEFEKYFINDKIDFYAPRTFGNGRSFFQVVDWKDWVITYLEAIYLLQEQYETIDIIGFSTGTVIALYLSQFKYKCIINNLFLCSPFLIYKKDFIIDIFFSSNIFSKILNKLYVWTLRFRFKSKNKFKGYRDTYNDFYSINDYCEEFGDVAMDTVLFDFIKFRPKQIFVNNIIILEPNDDDVIGDIFEQVKIINKVYKSDNQIQIIQIPSYLSNSTFQNKSNNLPKKSGHLIFKEKSEIIKDIYHNIKKFL